MKKMRKGKKMLFILLIAIAVIIATVVIVKIVQNVVQGPETPIDEIPQVIALPETTYSDMQVKNIQMLLLKENASDGRDETKVSMEIHNTTSETVTNEYLDAILIGPNEEVLGQMQTWIQQLKPGEQYKMEVILKGDLTATTQIKLVEK